MRLDLCEGCCLVFGSGKEGRKAGRGVWSCFLFLFHFTGVCYIVRLWMVLVFHICTLFFSSLSLSLGALGFLFFVFFFYFFFFFYFPGNERAGRVIYARWHLWDGVYVGGLLCPV